MPHPLALAPMASIPSPSSNTISLGPLEVHYYGIMIAIGVAIAFSIARGRFVERGGDGEAIDRLMLWSVAGGFLGARLAYVSTHTGRFFGEDATLAPWEVIAIWTGGLAFFGGLTAGTLTAVYLTRRWDLRLPWFADGAALALPIAQGIGRWGNWFNQELFGTPSTLPWAVEIDPRFRPSEYAEFATFHPTFLYESLLNLLVVAPILFWYERREGRRRGSLILLYLPLYGGVRFLMELLRTDTTFRFLGLSRNGLVALLAIVGGLIAWRRYENTPGGERVGDDDPTPVEQPDAERSTAEGEALPASTD